MSKLAKKSKKTIGGVTLKKRFFVACILTLVFYYQYKYAGICP
ncbi:MAG: hypothetical protein STSR0004_10490 [Peptococcaceae bacterium]